MTYIYLPSSSFVFRDCYTALADSPLGVLLTIIIFLAITTLFLAVLKRSRMSPLTYGVPAMLGSITNDFYDLAVGGNTPVVTYLRHSMMVFDNYYMYCFS